MDSILSFPLSGPTDANEFAWTKDLQSFREVIWNILLTEPGERLMRPEFGAGLKRYLHYPNNETTRRMIADVSLNALKRWEPRIDVIDLNVGSQEHELNQVTVRIVYRSRITGAQDAMQFGLQLQG